MTHKSEIQRIKNDNDFIARMRRRLLLQGKGLCSCTKSKIIVCLDIRDFERLINRRY